ncbi:hypothetical protein RUM44_006229 [Polyplax serrata]|uniref:RFX1-4/6/8-like BCD domain-containing protein n=1 Tax=Polyplax serrata TaxID=468196 RepID=A0ABR1AHK4_POLSC
MIQNFADKLENWINSALTDVPENLKTVKLKLGKRFCMILRRQMLLYQLTHTAQVVLNNCEMMNHINNDWKRINLGPITKQALLFTENTNDDLVETINYINGYWVNFKELIERQAAIEEFTEIVESIVHRCIVEMSEKKQMPLRKVAKTFILLWHVIESLISRDMTIHSAASFGSFHLIQTMFDEYMHYLVEMLHSEDVTKYLLKNVTLDVLPNLDSNWNECNDGNCFDLFDTTSNIRAITNLSDEGLEVLQDDLQNNSFSFYTSGPEFGFSKSNTPQTECSFISNQCEYTNERDEGPDGKFNNSTAFTEAIPLQEFNTGDTNCIEFSAGIFCQEALQYSSHNMQYQGSNYCEEETFECLG